MKMSIKVYYALKALISLADSKDAGIVNMKMIARENKIPLTFLEQIMSTLKKTGLVRSIRGKEGGYFLSRDASEISCYDVIKALSGKIQIIDRKAKSLSALDKFFDYTEQDIINKFSSVSLENLLADQKKFKKVVDFSI